MAFLNFSAELLIVTDKSRTMGILEDGAKDSTAMVVTSAFVKLLEKQYFTSKTAQSTLPINSLTGDNVKKNTVFNDLPNISDAIVLGKQKQAVTALKEREVDNPEIISINGQNVFLPKSTVRSRRFGTKTVHFAVSPIDLKDKVKAQSSIASVRLRVSGPRVSATDSGCGACGACGVCGGCALCGEVNFAVAAAAATAVTALSSASSVIFNAATRLTLAKSTQPLPPDVRGMLDRFKQVGSQFQ